MEEYPYHQLLNLNPMNSNTEWLVSHKVSNSEDTKLELRLGLGPPGEFDGYNDITAHGAKRAFQHTAKTKILGEKQPRSCENQCQKSSFFDLPISKKLAGMNQDFSQPKMTDRKACLTSLATVDADTTADNTSNERIAYSQVVGWPPIRSSRKNFITSTSLSKPANSESRNEKEGTISGGKPENSNSNHHQLFVKINMEGIPIGRKVNLSAYNSYEQLSLAIDDLFSGLLAARTDSSAIQNENKIEELAKADTCSLAGSGEYTLVYEDDEGDIILVGDVPWHMFVSTAKRLHVLKSSELPTQICSSVKEKTPLDPTPTVH